MDIGKQTINFEYIILEAHLALKLTADVIYDPSKNCYSVEGFRRQGVDGHSILPSVQVERIGTEWVHCDSKKASALSTSIGAAIDKHEELVLPTNVSLSPFTNE